MEDNVKSASIRHTIASLAVNLSCAGGETPKTALEGLIIAECIALNISAQLARDNADRTHNSATRAATLILDTIRLAESLLKEKLCLK